jgi:hypothetical protein
MNVRSGSARRPPGSLGSTHGPPPDAGSLLDEAFGNETG